MTGGFSPTVINGGADLNGSGVVNGRDDASEFYGSTSIIDGKLDCDAWGATANQCAAGDLAITGADDCSLVGYDGTPDGVTIEVLNGFFQIANGPLPEVFNAADPDNPDVGDSDFAWSAIRGRVDSNGNEFIDPDDCHFGIVGPADILGSSATCGFATTPAFADNGLVDLNGNGAITAADSCSDGCFFGHDVSSGFVMKLECPGFEGDPRNDVVGTAGSETLVGTAGADIICAFGGNDILRGRGGNDLLLGGGGADVLSGRSGADILRGGTGPTSSGAAAEPTSSAEAAAMTGCSATAAMTGCTATAGMTGWTVAPVSTGESAAPVETPSSGVKSGASSVGTLGKEPASLRRSAPYQFFTQNGASFGSLTPGRWPGGCGHPQGQAVPAREMFPREGPQS